ncbi:MAG: hypothetical protein QM496_21565 [Verrucomicrobiota bacterium]
MKQAITFLLTFILFHLIPQPGFSQDPTPVFEAADGQAITAKTGQRITVRGKVTEVRKTSSGTNFINFENSDFYLVTFKSDLTAFEKGEPAELYQGRHLAVTGVVSTYKGKPQMKLTHPDMVKIIDADAPLPAVKKQPDQVSKKAKPETTSSKSKSSEQKKKATPVNAKKYFK